MIPYQHIKAYVEYCIPNSKYMISVGSGDGSLEAKLEQDLDINITCVDPVDNIEFVKRRDYYYVTDLINDAPYVVGDCCILLMHDSYHVGYGYDMEAIDLLYPIDIVTYYVIEHMDYDPVTGSIDDPVTGSTDFYRYIKHTDEYKTIVKTGTYDVGMSYELALLSKVKKKHRFKLVSRYFEDQGDLINKIEADSVYYHTVTD